MCFEDCKAEMVALKVKVYGLDLLSGKRKIFEAKDVARNSSHSEMQLSDVYGPCSFYI